ncbi:hypothetical protein BGP77_10760 [Saccharospirillum sp. MSK14-1]|nr:hypothetical protein BGP77_10760 [Saccharospirillum sp. MSK14-1]
MLTAAHCVSNLKHGARFAVLLGNHSNTYGYVHCPSSGPCRREGSITPPAGYEFSGLIALDALPSSGFTLARSTQTVAVHPGYNAATVRNDVALIRLPINAVHDSIALTSRAQSTFLGDATVIGHGDTRERTSGESDDITPEPDIALQTVDLPTVSDATCSAEYGIKLGDSNVIHGASMLCAGFADGVDPLDGDQQKDSCQGDSGGPLVYGSGSSGSDLEQIGIVSWGFDCAKTYGVYTDIKELRSWIVNKMNENPWRSSGGGAVGLWALLLSLPLAMARCRRFGVSFATLVAALTLAGCSSLPQGAGEPEVLFNPEVKAEGLEFSVVSHGCTEDGHLFLRVEGNRLTLLRTQKDMCRTAPQLLRFVMPLPVSDNVWQIENPVRYSNRVGLGGAQPQ